MGIIIKIEVRQKTVNYNVYIADDGQEFDNEKDCVHHDKILSGKGKLYQEYTDYDYYNDTFYKTFKEPICNKCHGKGYLEKKTKIVWE